MDFNLFAIYFFFNTRWYQILHDGPLTEPWMFKLVSLKKNLYINGVVIYTN